MQKKTIIFIIISVLLLISGGVYLWWSQEKESSLTSVDYIQIKDTPEGKIVENTKEGVSMKVPEGWEVQLPTNEQEPVSFYSPEVVQGEEGEEFMCKITSLVSREKTNIIKIQNEINYNISELFTIKSHNFEIIEVTGIKALKSVLNTFETGYSITVNVPFNDRLYTFIIYAASNYEEKCSQKFDEFLKTVSIK